MAAALFSSTRAQIVSKSRRRARLRECTMVLARYGAPGLATGTLGVLGPMRMAYGRTISTVSFVADLLSNLVEDMLAD